jgi:hypothetical protein
MAETSVGFIEGVASDGLFDIPSGDVNGPDCEFIGCVVSDVFTFSPVHPQIITSPAMRNRLKTSFLSMSTISYLFVLIARDKNERTLTQSALH